MEREDFRLEGIKTANRILALTKEMKTNAATLDKLASLDQIIVDREAMAYSQLGTLFMALLGLVQAVAA